MLRKILGLPFAASLGVAAMMLFGFAYAHAQPANSSTATSLTAISTTATSATATSIVLANVNDFEFESFHADYTLGRDADGHSTLHTVETLVAVFPEHDQNRGIRRLLPERYQGHPTDLDVISVTDAQGEHLRYEEDSEDDIRMLTIAGDEYVHGRQTYVIEYEQRNVTAHFDDTGRDEFYWDVNGLDWAQPFAQVSATVDLVDGVSAGLTSHMSAVQGGMAATNPAVITVAEGGRSLAVESDGPLAAHQTLSFAIGFDPGTFTARESGFFAAPAPTISAVAALVTAGGVVWAAIVRRRYLRDAKGRGIIVPQYEPLEGVSVLTAANILGDKTGRAVPAQIIDLAVRGHLRLLDQGAVEHSDRLEAAVKTPGKSKSSGYLVELLDASTITDEHEYKLVQAVFGHDPAPGGIRDLAQPDEAVAEALEQLRQRVASDAVDHQLRRSYPSKTVTWLIVIASLAALAGVIFGALALEDDFGGSVPIATLFASIVGLVVAIVLISHKPLEARGVEIRDHLRGQKMYIKLAEADRLRYLQSPEGAERRPVRSADAALGADSAPDSAASSAAASLEGHLDNARVVHLYERLLPYAMLFGEEKKWAAELGRLYETSGESPGWYLGATAFSASSFSSSFSSISSGLSGAYSSSSSGGSSGASAGGGGGGGGGGGV